MTHAKKITTLGISIWSLAALFFLYEFFTRTFIGTIATNVMDKFHLTASELSMIGAAYYMTYAIMQVPVGGLIDRFGIKKQLVMANLCCVAGLFLFAFAHTYTLLIISRLLIGFGSSFAFISLLMLAIHWFPTKHFGFFSGATQILGAIGPMLAGAPLLWLLHTTNNHWETAIIYVAVAGIILSLCLAIFLKDHPTPIANPRLENHLAIKHKLWGLIKNKKLQWIAVYSFSIYASISLLGAIWGTYYLETRGISKTLAANITSTIWLGLAIGSPLVGFLSDAIKNRRKPLFYCALLGILITSCISYWPTHSPWVFSCLYFSLGFIGAGQTLSFTALSEKVNQNEQATAMGINNTAVMLGGATVPLLVGFAVERAHAHYAHIHHIQQATHYSHADFSIGFSIMPILYMIASWVAYKKLD